VLWMKSWSSRNAGAVSLVLLFGLAAGGTSLASAGAGGVGDLAGSWSLVSVANVAPDGARTEPYGPSPRGFLSIDGAGRYAIQIYRPDRAKFAAEDKGKGTAAEFAAAMIGSNMHFGRVTVDAAAHTLVFAIERASFPNWEGTEQRRAYAVEGARLRYVVPLPALGAGAVGEVVWERLP
jgi:hypothetical protein